MIHDAKRSNVPLGSHEEWPAREQPPGGQDHRCCSRRNPGSAHPPGAAPVDGTDVLLDLQLVGSLVRPPVRQVHQSRFDEVETGEPGPDLLPAAQPVAEPAVDRLVGLAAEVPVVDPGGAGPFQVGPGGGAGCLVIERHHATSFPEQGSPGQPDPDQENPDQDTPNPDNPD